MKFDVAQIFQAIPPILWTVFAFVGLFMFRNTIRDDLLPRLSPFKAMGVELAFVDDSIDTAIEMAEKTLGGPSHQSWPHATHLMPNYFVADRLNCAFRRQELLTIRGALELSVD